MDYGLRMKNKAKTTENLQKMGYVSKNEVC
jgi:hypothetical protein